MKAHDAEPIRLSRDTRFVFPQGVIIDIQTLSRNLTAE